MFRNVFVSVAIFIMVNSALNEAFLFGQSCGCQPVVTSCGQSSLALPCPALVKSDFAPTIRYIYLSEERYSASEKFVVVNRTCSPNGDTTFYLRPVSQATPSRPNVAPELDPWPQPAAPSRPNWPSVRPEPFPMPIPYEPARPMGPVQSYPQPQPYVPPRPNTPSTPPQPTDNSGKQSIPTVPNKIPRAFELVDPTK